MISELTTISNLPPVSGALLPTDESEEEEERHLSTTTEAVGSSVSERRNVAPAEALNSENSSAQPGSSSHNNYDEHQLTSIRVLNPNTTIATVEPITINTQNWGATGGISSTSPKASDVSSQSDTFSLNDVNMNLACSALVECDGDHLNEGSITTNGAITLSSQVATGSPSTKPDTSVGEASNSAMGGGKLSLKRQIKKEFKAAISGDSKA